MKILAAVAALALSGCMASVAPDAIPVDIMALRASAQAEGAKAIHFANRRNKGPEISTASDDVRWWALGVVAGSTLNQQVQIKSYENGTLCTTKQKPWSGACFRILPSNDAKYPYLMVGQYGNGAKLNEPVRLKKVY